MLLFLSVAIQVLRISRALWESALWSYTGRLIRAPWETDGLTMLCVCAYLANRAARAAMPSVPWDTTNAYKRWLRNSCFRKPSDGLIGMPPHRLCHPVQNDDRGTDKPA